MYEAHFGLKSRPFGSKAEGAGVFSGPRQVETMTKLKKGLTALDAVVTVTGPVGVGKTTIVSRALDTISPNRMAAWVGRMQLAPDEVLQLLLAGFGIKAQAKGTIQRFAIFRRLLAERAAAGAPVAIVVEDAQRLGVDALVELEALTAADTGDATSANIILMGQSNLKKLLAQPELARLNQRTRLRQTIEPLSLPEVNGYLKHCIREADGDYDKIFAAGVAEIVFACSEGIPRMINTLCESAMSTAMEDGLKSVSAALMHKVAVDAFGYEGPLPEKVVDVPSEDSVEVPIIEVKAAVAELSAPETGKSAAEDLPDIDWEKPPAAEPVAVAESPDDESELPAAARNIVVESGHYPELPKAPEDSPLSAANDSSEEPDSNSDPQPDSEIDTEEPVEAPELFNDTQPELTTLKQPQSDEAVTDILDVDTESTAIQEQLPESAIAAPATEVAPEAVSPRSAVDTVDEPVNSDDDNENFDLDAVLSIETDATNVMEGITPNLDELAAKNKAEDAAAPAAPDLDDLPTLTDSMQVDVEKEAERAKQLDKGPEAPATAARPEPQQEPNSTPEAAAQAAPEPKPQPEPAPEAVAQAKPEPKPEPEPAPEAVAQAKPEPKPEPESTPEAIAKPRPEPQPKPDVAATPAEPEPAVEIALEAELEAELPAKPPEEKKAPASKPVAQVSEMTARIAALDPASRSNDVDALEAALDAAKSGKLDEMMAPPPLPQVSGTEAVAEDASAALPEIVLDDKIASKQTERPAPAEDVMELIQPNSLDEKVESRPAARPVPEEHVTGISKANSLEEFSDAMAETLFGNEDFDQIAAAVAANPPAAGEEAGIQAEATGIEPAELSLANEEPVTEAPAVSEPVAKSASPAPQIEDGGLRESQQIRADMLQSLNASNEAAKSKSKIAEEVELATPSAAQPPPGPKGPQPEPIENQINTSITQTLEALNVAKVADNVAAEKEEKEEKKGGLFSRFRKSS